MALGVALILAQGRACLIYAGGTVRSVRATLFARPGPFPSKGPSV
jgi:hypothetical protein